MNLRHRPALLASSLILIWGCHGQNTTRSEGESAPTAPASRAAIEGRVAERLVEEPAPSQPHYRYSLERLPLPGEGEYRLHRFSFDLREIEIRLVDAAARPLDVIGSDEEAELVINAGFFDPEHEIVGLAQSDSELLAPFDLGLSGGVLTIDGDVARLYETERYSQSEGIEFAIQCRPRLVVAGELNIGSDNGLRADRTALCIRDQGRSLDVFIARTDQPNGHGGPTLYSFARHLVELGCEEALNLDGGPSTAAAWQDEAGERYLPPRGYLRQAIVFKRPSSSAR